MSEQTMKDSRTDVNNNSDLPTNKKNWFERNPKKTIFFVILLGILILPFVLEGVAYFLVKGEDREKMRAFLITGPTKIKIYEINGYKLYSELVDSQGKVKMCYQPYSIWKTCKTKTDLINVDNYGIRASISQPNTQNKKEFIIYTFGGSTTFCFESDDNNTWPSHLQRLLNAQNNSKYHYKVVNFGVDAYRNMQEIIRLILEAQNSFKFYGKPSLVIFYDGINDSLYDFAYIYDYIGGAHFDIDKIASRFESVKAKELFLIHIPRILIPENYRKHIKLLFINIFTLMRRDLIQEDKRVYNIPQDKNAISEKATQIKHYYKTNIELINHLAKINNFKVAYFLQSTLFDKDEGYLSEYDKKVCDSVCKLWKAPYHITSSKLAELAKEYPNFIDVRDIFNIPNISVHLDNCHVVPKGNELIAKRLFSELKKRGFVD